MSTDVILTRRCQIAQGADGEPQPLRIEFFKPVQVDDEEVTMTFAISSELYSTSKIVIGGDDFQALVFALDISLVLLQVKQRDGYRIWNLEEGDLDYHDFWAFRKGERKYIPSKLEAARWGAPERPPTRILTPSHRVAVDEAEGVDIAVFRVALDGTDSVFQTLTDVDKGDVDPYETARVLGQIILMDTPGGRELFGCERDLPHRSKG